MIIELNKLINKKLRIARAIPMGSDRHPVQGCSYAAPVELDAILTGKEKEFKLQGSIKAHLMLTCDRCLTTFEQDIEDTLDLVFIPRTEMEGEPEVELTKDDLNVASYIDSIDLCQVIDEQLILALPMKILCSDNCPGLCPQCGKNLSKGSCSCSDDRVDDRLIVLMDVKKRLTGGK